MISVGQNRMSAPYMTVCMVISLREQRMYIVYTYKCMVLANPSDGGSERACLDACHNGAGDCTLQCMP